MDRWVLRDELLRSVKQWYLVLGFILVGGLIGYIVSYLLPPTFQATADLYVGIDVVRVNEMEYLIPLAAEEPLNLDDYKNWQLKQLSDILYLELVMQKTLDKLQESNSAWQDVTLEDFKKSVDIYWYDTGIWRLEVENHDRSLAENAVQTWLDTGYATIADLLAYADEAAILDSDLQIIKGASSIQKSQIARLKAFLDSSQEWLLELNTLSENEPLPDEKLIELQKWTLVYLKPSDMWQVPLGEFPTRNEQVKHYTDWLEMVQLDAEISLEESQKQFEILIQDRNEILPEYHQALDDSLGLSANIVLQKNSSSPMILNPRSKGTDTISGASFGLILWLLFAVFRIKGQENDQD